MTLAREDISVLVCEAHTVGSIAVIRSLGAAGYKVIACSPDRYALGFRSRYASEGLICPEYGEHNQVISWLDAVIEKYKVGCIIPSEGFLLAVRPSFEEYSHLLPFSKSEKTVFHGMSKFDLFDGFAKKGFDEKLSRHLPPFQMVLSEKDEIDSSSLPFPVYLKTDSAHAIQDVSGNVYVAHDETELEAYITKLQGSFSRFLLQGHVKGVGVGVFVLRWNGQVYASFMHRRLHEVPHTGGASSFRESWWHQEIYDDAIARLEGMDWQGVGMLEYRWNESKQEFYLLEFNGRFWGSLHLALYAGVDFPALLVDAFFGSPREVECSNSKIKCRLTFPKEMQYVWSCLKAPELTLKKKACVILEFMTLGLDPRVRSDMLYGRDWGLYFPMLLRSVRDFLK